VTVTTRSEFSYDGLGRRIEVVTRDALGVPITDNHYVWSGNTLSEERDGTGANVTKRFFGGGEQINGTSYYFTRDHLGSVREMADSTGAAHAQYEYDPYGVRTKVSGNLDADFGFTGYWHHGPSGLDLSLYRAYSPTLGRWLSRDPIGEVGGLNLYGYVHGNPLNKIDTSGLMSAADCAILQRMIDRLQGQLERGTDVSNKILDAHQSNLTELFVMDRFIDVSSTLAGSYIARGLDTARLALTSSRVTYGVSRGVDLARAGALSGPGIGRFTNFRTPGVGGAILGPLLAHIGGEVVDYAIGEGASNITTNAIRRQDAQLIESLDDSLSAISGQLREHRQFYRDECCSQ
jgi:RHS repeat-associated protein